MKQPDFPILCYYGVEDTPNNLFVRPADFQRHLSVLKQKRRTTISLEEIKRFIEDDKDLPDAPVAITFEGCRRSILEIAAPLLKKHGFTATIFVATQDVGKEGFLNWHELEELETEYGFEIGCSGKSYPSMDSLSAIDMKSEVDSKSIFKEHGLHPNFFSYRMEAYAPENLKRIGDIIKKNNYMGAVTTRDTLTNKFLNAYALSRRIITREVHAGKFLQLLTAPKISICMITKNEEQLLGKCLNSIKDIADEIIIVDTGSTDNTVSIAESFGARVIRQEWTNDFSKTRNTYLREAACDWILVLDADEIIEKHDLVTIKKLVELKNDAYLMPIYTYTNNNTHIGFIKLDEPKHGCTGYFITKVIRLFRNNKKYMYLGEVHELIDESVLKSRGNIVEVDVPIHHLEALKGPEAVRQKQIAYMEYSKQKLEQNPEDIKALCDIAVVNLKFLGNLDEAEKYARKALDISSRTKPSKLGEGNSRPHFILGEILVRKQHYSEAVKLYETAMRIDPSKEREARENIARIKNIL